MVTLKATFDKPHDYVDIKIYTTAFRKVFEQRVGFVPAGAFTFTIDPTNLKGSVMANGFYYVEVRTPTDRWMLKLLILK